MTNIEYYIDVNLKIKDVEFNKVHKNIGILLKALLMDFSSTMEPELYKHTQQGITETLTTRYKSFFWGDVLRCFDNMRAGFYEIDRITTININKIFARHNSHKNETAKIEADKFKDIPDREIDQLTASKFGAALLWKLENCVIPSEKGAAKTKDWEKWPIKKLIDMREETGRLPLIEINA